MTRTTGGSSGSPKLSVHSRTPSRSIIRSVTSPPWSVGRRGRPGGRAGLIGPGSVGVSRRAPRRRGPGRRRACSAARAPARAGPGGSQVRGRAQDLAHLHLGERRAGAAPHAAAERDPRQRVRPRALEPALGAEGGGVRPQVLAADRQPDARGDLHARRAAVAGDLDGREQPPRRDRQRRADPQRLLDDGVEVGGVAVAQAGLHRRMAREALERPRERRGRAVVAADEQRHELVAQVAVGRRPAVLVALLEQERQHRVVARVGRRRAMMSSSSASKRSTATRKRPHGLRGPRSRWTSAIASIRGIERTLSSVVSTACAQPRRLVVAARAEDDAQDDLERQLAHPLERRDAPAPGAQLAGARGRRRRGRSARIRSPWNGTCIEPALAHVLVAVEEQDRVLAGERAQELPALRPRARSPGRAGRRRAPRRGARTAPSAPRSSTCGS